MLYTLIVMAVALPAAVGSGQCLRWLLAIDNPPTFLRAFAIDGLLGLLVMGTIVISLRHALEDRLVTPPINIAKGMAAGLLRSLGVPAAQADRLACEAADDILPPQKSTLADRK